jgi:galactokinase
MTGAGAVQNAFVALYGGQPQVVTSAPGRVNLIGEHVDYNGGRCLPMAIPESTYAALRLRPDATVTIASGQQPEPWIGDARRLGDAAGWVAYAAGVAWAMRERGVDVPGFDLLVDGHVPLGAGLSSSAALECSVALALNTALGLPDDEPARRSMIEDCIRAERDVAGAPTGGMDQTVSMLGRAGHALLLDCATGRTTDVPWLPEVAGLTLMVVDTRAAHALVDGGYAARRASCEEAARLLGVGLLGDVTDHGAALDALAHDPVLRRRARHVFTELERVDAAVAALEVGDFDALGTHLTGSHVSLRDDYEVSCAELDVTVDACLAAGARGARMTGGGFGGSAIALLPEEAAAAAADGVRTEFEARGWATPRFWQPTAAVGARVLAS